MAVAVLDKDTGWQKILDVVRGPQPHVTVGIQGEDSGEIVDENGEITMVVLAGVHEFGREDGTIPSRSYIRATVDANREAYLALRKRLAGLVLAGKLTPKRALSLLGEKVKSDIQARMEAGLEPELAESTKRRRIQGEAEADGSRVFKPLIDTGDLKRSITYQVRDAE